MTISKKHFNKIASLINRNLISGEGTINDKLIIDLGLYFANENKNFNSSKWCQVCYNVKISEKRFFKGVEIKDPTFNETLPFDNDAEKLAEIKMSNEAYDMKGGK